MPYKANADTKPVLVAESLTTKLWTLQNGKIFPIKFITISYQILLPSLHIPMNLLKPLGTKFKLVLSLQPYNISLTKDLLFAIFNIYFLAEPLYYTPVLKNLATLLDKLNIHSKTTYLFPYILTPLLLYLTIPLTFKYPLFLLIIAYFPPGYLLLMRNGKIFTMPGILKTSKKLDNTSMIPSINDAPNSKPILPQ
jgi:hypothetical protein